MMKKARDEKGVQWRGKIWIVSCRERRTLREDGDLDWRNVKEVLEDADLSTGQYMSVRGLSEEAAREREERKAHAREIREQKAAEKAENVRLFGTAGGAADLLRRLVGPNRNIAMVG